MRASVIREYANLLQEIRELANHPDLTKHNVATYGDGTHHSITALTHAQGGAVRNPEFVVFNRDQVKIRRLLLTRKIPK